METGTGPKSPERFAEPVLDIQVIPEDLEEKGYRRGYKQVYIMRTRR